MLTLLRGVFGVASDQVIGPSWIHDASYSIVATLAPKTTREELQQMHLNLLIDRFGLSYHRVNKETRGYELRLDTGVPKLAPNGAQSGGSAAEVAPDADPNWLWRRWVADHMTYLSFRDP
jgi:uncharacterized protein (TIGR03435 family)